MWASEPIPGNPWPHDMVLTIENAPHTLYELLWIREAWDLQMSAKDLPPLLIDTPARVDPEHPGSTSQWQDAWPQLWHSCLEHAAKVVDHSVFERLSESALGSDERMRLLQQLHGPTWRDRFGNEAFTTSYDEWNRRQFEALTSPRPVAYDKTPEHASLDALIPAWRAGLTRMVLIPCHGTFTRRIGPSALLLTEETRNDRARYAEALHSFA